MKITTRALVALLAASAATPALAQYGASAPARQPQAPAAQSQDVSNVHPSKGALKALADLQAAIKANDLASIPAKIAAAQAVATTKEDKVILGKLQIQAAVATNDNAALSAAIETLASSGYIAAPQMSRLYVDLGAKLYEGKQLDKAAAAFERAVSLDSTNADAQVDLGETRFSQGRKAEAVASMERAIQIKLAAGQKPEEAVYKRALSLAYDAQLPEATNLAREWLTAYPSPSSWRDSIAVFRNVNHPDEESVIDLMRLMSLTGALTPSDLSAYLNALKEQSNFIEGQTVLDKATGLESSADVKAIAAALKAKPRVTAGELSAAVKSAGTGAALLRIGDRFYGLGEYSKAADTYKAAKAKSMDSNLINERIGVALAAAGDKAGATAALKSVTGVRAGVAQFWLLYLQNKA
jgi:tetratricopeptide (TPR) repeat protein